jgi:hypothetical protein
MAREMGLVVITIGVGFNDVNHSEGPFNFNLN